MSDTTGVWLDIRKLKEDKIMEFTYLAVNTGYDGIFLTLNQIQILDMIPKSMKVIIYMMEQEIETCNHVLDNAEAERLIVVADNQHLLEQMDLDIEKGLYMKVDSQNLLEKATELTKLFPYMLIEFEMKTNIPLELVLAFSQHNNSCICKIVKSSNDGWIASMVMEIGCNIVILETDVMQDIIDTKEKLISMQNCNISMKELTITEIKHVGMGDRVCIDTTSLMDKNEGFILGSTSNGGILVSSETHYLPYMELRPFRVNAGGLHMYIWSLNGVTSYLSELKAGKELMAVNSEGNSRGVIVGRVKIERRPLLLIIAADDSNNEVNVFVQDDWHVRITAPGGLIVNCTELKPGDKVLGYTCKPGRHVGINIDETIIEK